MRSESPTPRSTRPNPAGPRWILAGFGLLFLSWLVFMGYYVWKVNQQPPRAEPPPVRAATNPPAATPGRP